MSVMNIYIAFFPSGVYHAAPQLLRLDFRVLKNNESVKSRKFSSGFKAFWDQHSPPTVPLPSQYKLSQQQPLSVTQTVVAVRMPHHVNFGSLKLGSELATHTVDDLDGLGVCYQGAARGEKVGAPAGSAPEVLLGRRRHGVRSIHLST